MSILKSDALLDCIGRHSEMECLFCLYRPRQGGPHGIGAFTLCVAPAVALGIATDTRIAGLAA